MKKKFINYKERIIGHIALVVLIGTLGMASCTYHINDFEVVVIPDSISFELDIIPIFEARCNDPGCHSGAIPPDLQRDVGYNNLIFGGYVTDTTTAENNSLYQEIDGGSMEVYATDQDRTFIKEWIEDGAKNN